MRLALSILMLIALPVLGQPFSFADPGWAGAAGGTNVAPPPPPPWAATNLPFVRVVLESDALTFSDQAGTTPASDNGNLRRWSNAPTLAVYGSVKDANAIPVYKTSAGPNSLPWIQFTHASEMALITDASYNFSAPITFFVVGKSSQSGIAGSMLFDGPSHRMAAYYWSDNKLYTYSSGAGPSATIPNTGWQLYTIIFASGTGNTKIRTNGVQAASGTISLDSYDYGLIGNSSGYDSGFDGGIAAFILCNTNLQGTDLSDAETALKSKYGIP